MSDDFPTEVNPYELSARMVSLDEKLLAAIQIINNNQDKIGDDVAKIKEAVYNPDIGLYARLRVVEDQKKSTSKLLWIIISMGVGCLGAYIVSVLV